MFNHKIGLVYYIASMQGKTMDYNAAISIAEYFTYEELKRIWFYYNKKQNSSSLQDD